MDNNNSNNIGQPPYQPTQPNMPYVQPNQTYQPYPNQTPTKPPKQPMSPAKKKRLIIGLSAGGAALVLAIVAAIVIPILLRVDYSSAYNAAKELKPKIYDIYHSYSCEYVVDYVDSTYTNIKSYAEYIEECKKVYQSNTNELVAKLENTDGVKRNSEINAKFAKFKAEYASISPDNEEALMAKLNLWQARHNFVYTADDLSYSSSSDADFTTAANYLINSGNDQLKTYGEGWLERKLAVAAAYRAYYAASWATSSQLYAEYNNKKSELADWIAANRPDINVIAPLNLENTSKMYSDFSDLYELIRVTYQQNYNAGSGDCTEFLGEVICS